MPTTLHPGQRVGLEVTLKVGESTEPLSHLAVVETDDPEYPTREFFTFAKPHPRFRLEPKGAQSIVLAPSATFAASLIAFSYGMASESPPSLDEAVLASDAGPEWVGPSRERVLDDGLIERSRPLTVQLVGKGDPGERLTRIHVSLRGETLGMAALHWEVTPGIKAAPRALLVNSASAVTLQTITLRAQDDQGFEVVELSSDLPGIRNETMDPGLRTVHVVRVAIEPGRENVRRWGKLTIKTTHPTQRIIKIPVFVTGPSPVSVIKREAS